jgi:hypothetical protein
MWYDEGEMRRDVLLYALVGTMVAMPPKPPGQDAVDLPELPKLQRGAEGVAVVAAVVAESPTSAAQPKGVAQVVPEEVVDVSGSLGVQGASVGEVAGVGGSSPVQPARPKTEAPTDGSSPVRPADDVLDVAQSVVKGSGDVVNKLRNVCQELRDCQCSVLRQSLTERRNLLQQEIRKGVVFGGNTMPEAVVGSGAESKVELRDILESLRAGVISISESSRCVMLYYCTADDFQCFVRSCGADDVASNASLLLIVPNRFVCIEIKDLALKQKFVDAGFVPGTSGKFALINLEYETKVCDLLDAFAHRPDISEKIKSFSSAAGGALGPEAKAFIHAHEPRLFKPQTPMDAPTSAPASSSAAAADFERR